MPVLKDQRCKSFGMQLKQQKMKKTLRRIVASDGVTGLEIMVRKASQKNTALPHMHVLRISWTSKCHRVLAFLNFNVSVGQSCINAFCIFPFLLAALPSGHDQLSSETIKWAIAIKA